MRLIVLGRWSPFPPADGACPGYLVEAGGIRVLLDCGSGVVSRLQRFCTAYDLSALVLSHVHSDHVTDVYTLRMALEWGRLPERYQGRLLTFAPAGSAGILAAPHSTADSRARFLDFFDFRDMVPDCPVSVGPLTLTFAPTRHPVPCFAVRAEAEGRSLVYTADTAPCGEVAALARGADLLLCEATLLEHETHVVPLAGHLTAGMAGALAHEAGVRRLVLTHFFATKRPEESRAQAAKEFPGELLIAEEGTAYEV